MRDQGKLLQCICANSEKVPLSPKAMQPSAGPQRLGLETEQIDAWGPEAGGWEAGREGLPRVCLCLGRLETAGEEGPGLACWFLPPGRRRVGTNSSHHCLVPGGPNLQHCKGCRGCKRFFQTLRYPLPSALTSLPPTAPRRW